MPFVKVQKNKAYFKRFQVKFRRRREGKTDYYARKRLVVQAKNKYNNPKYRLVVRFTNTQVICQIVYSTINGDKTMASAYSSELGRYGLTVGLKNYSAAYCTGLLVGRRVLKKLGLFDSYTGVGDDEEDEVTGEIVSVTEGKRTYFVDELAGDRKPFRCFLDVGLQRTTLGARVFGALKGASDAGLDIPHNHKKFPGYDADAKDYDPSIHRERIFGAVVADYMRSLQEEDEEAGTTLYQERFSKYIEAGLGPDELEGRYEEVHKAIRANPEPKHALSNKARAAKVTHDKKYKHPARRTHAERAAAVQVKLAAMQESSDEESGDDSE